MWVVVTVVAAGGAGGDVPDLDSPTRVDRLHARAAAAYSALDAQSVRRAAAAAELGERRRRSPTLQAAARAVARTPTRRTGRRPRTT